MQCPHLPTWPQSRKSGKSQRNEGQAVKPCRAGLFPKSWAKRRNLAFVPTDPPRSSDLDARPQRCQPTLSELKVKPFGKWKKNQLTSLGYIATHKLLARVRRFGESLEYFEFQVKLSIIDMQFDTPSAVTPEMPNAHAPCLTLLIVGFASVQLLFLEHQIIAKLPGLMPQQQKRKS